MKKTRLIVLSILSTLTLTSCSLFNDDDIKIENHFKDKEAASEEKPSEATIGGVGSSDIKIDETEALVFKNVVYSNMEGDKIKNTYKKDDDVYKFEYAVNNNLDYAVDEKNNNFDLYIPKGLNKDDKQTVVLFVHGGAWISGLKTHVNPYVKEFTKRGYISATVEYTLLKEAMDDPSLSVFRDLDEIDACISTLKSCLVEYGFNESKLSLVIGGVSSGAHLTMLYTYSRGDAKRPYPMNMKFIIDVVGPTDIRTYAWKQFKVESEEALNSQLTYAYISANSDNLAELKVSGRDYSWNEYETMRIANGMCGLPYTVDEIKNASSDKINITDPNTASNSMTKAGGGEDLLSVTKYINGSSLPVLCAYAGKDNVVGIAQFANLQNVLMTEGVEYEYFYFKTAGHVDLDKESEKTTYNNFVNRIEDWLKNK